MKLKIGDRVQCIKCINGYGGSWNGMIGVVVCLPKENDHFFGVDFKQQSRTGRGHDLNGSIKTATGWWFHGNNIRRYLKKISKQFEFSF